MDVTKPEIEFGPVDITYRDAYLTDLNDPRTLADLAFFNATGRRRKTHKEKEFGLNSDIARLA